jgi:hypothetical protein
VAIRTCVRRAFDRRTSAIAAGDSAEKEAIEYTNSRKMKMQ